MRGIFVLLLAPLTLAGSGCLGDAIVEETIHEESTTTYESRVFVNGVEVKPCALASPAPEPYDLESTDDVVGDLAQTWHIPVEGCPRKMTVFLELLGPQGSGVYTVNGQSAVLTRPDGTEAARQGGTNNNVAITQASQMKLIDYTGGGASAVGGWELTLAGMGVARYHVAIHVTY